MVTYTYFNSLEFRGSGQLIFLTYILNVICNMYLYHVSHYTLHSFKTEGDECSRY